MISKKNLILLGMMGAGKTTIGKLVAKKLNLDFYDIDQIIEKENNMKINDIFQKKGETFFRKQEEYTTINYLKKNILLFHWVEELLLIKILETMFYQMLNLFG